MPLRWWVQATMLLATFWLAFAVAMPLWAAWLVTGLLAVVCYGTFLTLGSAKVEVDGDELRAGGAHIPLGFVSKADPLDAEQARRVHGVDADARAFLVTRPYLKRAVRVWINDPADPTPYWLLSTRHPHDLAAALGTGNAGADVEPDPADDSLEGFGV